MSDYVIKKYLGSNTASYGYMLKNIISEMERSFPYVSKENLVWKTNKDFAYRIITSGYGIDHKFDNDSIYILGIKVEFIDDAVIFKDWINLVYKKPYQLFTTDLGITYKDLASMASIIPNDSRKIPKIKKVIFNNPATIVYWEDGSKTVVKCQKGDIFDKEKGLTMAFFKKCHGNKGNFNDELRKWIADI